MRIEPASPEQAGTLTEIARAAKRSWGYPERMMAAWEQSLTISPDFIDSNPVCVAMEDSRVIGFYGLVAGGDAWVLEHLWVHPESMGRGAGRALLEHASRAARLGGAADLEIEADPHAERFYVRQGAVQVGEIVSELTGETRVLPRLRLSLRASTGPASRGSRLPASREEPSMSSPAGIVRFHRVLRAAPERVYRAFLDPDAMVKWLPPHGFTGKVHEMDARVGGGYRMSFTNFGTGGSHSFGGRYVELVPGERIRYTDRFDDPNLPGEMQVTISLRPVACGTELHITQEGIPSVIPVEFCYLGWQESLSLLAHLVEPEIPDGA